ncbi:MAG: aminotransferase class I/II-fold pyridoxal phosphate-dependent enzyme [Candidatus Latescibacterota bacterium]|jgi:aminotransferase
MKESVIRLMTRLAMQHQAVNLSQGFTDEAPLFELVWGGIAAELGGTDERIEHLENLTLRQIRDEIGGGEGFIDLPLRQVLARLQNPRDRYNQYSFPFGLPELRQAIAGYTERFYGFRPDPETEITVVLGATEGLSSLLRATCSPGEALVVFQPFHEMYPSQADIFGLEARYTTLREDRAAGVWNLDREELRRAAGPGARAIILNTPHNPTGKVFSEEDLRFVADLARERDLFVFTDEIYEHIVYDGRQHHCLAAFAEMRERTFVVNSISKTGSATGWRVGWVLSPPAYTTRIRAIHDTLVIQAPTPLQKGAARLLNQPDEVFRGMWQSYAAKRQVLMDGLRRVGFRLSPPEGSYYLFADYREVPALASLSPMDAAMWLIQQVGVASVPGDNFYRVGNEGDRYLRFAFCRSIESLQEASTRLARHLG